MGTHLSSRPRPGRTRRNRNAGAGASRHRPARHRPSERGDGCHASRAPLCEVGHRHRGMGHLRPGGGHACLAMSWRERRRRHTGCRQFLDLDRHAGRDDRADPRRQRRRLPHPFGQDRRQRSGAGHRPHGRHIRRPSRRRERHLRCEPRLAARNRHQRAEQRCLARLGGTALRDARPVRHRLGPCAAAHHA